MLRALSQRRANQQLSRLVEDKKPRGTCLSRFFNLYGDCSLIVYPPVGKYLASVKYLLHCYTSAGTSVKLRKFDLK